MYKLSHKILSVNTLRKENEVQNLKFCVFISNCVYNFRGDMCQHIYINSSKHKDYSSKHKRQKHTKHVMIVICHLRNKCDEFEQNLRDTSLI